MTNTGRQIANLMIDNGKTAADMTHAVKVLGNGSMQKGFSRIGVYFSEEVAAAAAKGLTTGRMQGGFVGVLGTAAVCGIIAYAVNRKKQNEVHETEGRKILCAMEESAPETEIIPSEDLPENTVVSDTPATTE